MGLYCHDSPARCCLVFVVVVREVAGCASGCTTMESEKEELWCARRNERRVDEDDDTTTIELEVVFGDKPSTSLIRDEEDLAARNPDTASSGTNHAATLARQKKLVLLLFMFLLLVFVVFLVIQFVPSQHGTSGTDHLTPVPTSPPTRPVSFNISRPNILFILMDDLGYGEIEPVRIHLHARAQYLATLWCSCCSLSSYFFFC